MLQYRTGSTDRYTKYEIKGHQFELSCSILIVNHGIVSLTLLIVHPTLFVISCIFYGGLHIYSFAVTVTYHVVFQPNFDPS
jgi:hypothetical protein